MNVINDGLRGIIAQTQMRPAFTINNNMTDSTSKRHVFAVDEILLILKDINKQALNTIPVDYENFINLPYFENVGESKDGLYVTDAELYQKQENRYIYCQEIFDGYKFIELIKDTRDLEKVFERIHEQRDTKDIEESQQSFNRILQKIQDQQIKLDKFDQNFRFVTSPETFKFGLSLIERAMVKDTSIARYDQFLRDGYQYDSRNSIGSNIHMESILQNRLINAEFSIAQVMI